MYLKESAQECIWTSEEVQNGGYQSFMCRTSKIICHLLC